MAAMRRVVSGLLMATATAAPLPAAALDIDGLQPLAPLTLQGANGIARQQRMEISHPQGKLVIQPWAGFLPARLIDQHIVAERQLWPGGPSDVITFARAGAQQPWIRLGNHSRRGEAIIGNWHLQRNRQGWHVSDGKQTLYLQPGHKRAAPVRINHGTDRWRVYLLDMTAPQAQGMPPAAQQEPRASWAAVRQD